MEDIDKTCPESETYNTLSDLDNSTILGLGCGTAEQKERSLAVVRGSIVALEVDDIQHE